MSTKGPYDFKAGRAKYKAYNVDSLRFALNDAHEAAIAMKDHDPIAEAWYIDDGFTIADQLRQRLSPKKVAKRVKIKASEIDSVHQDILIHELQTSAVRDDRASA